MNAIDEYNVVVNGVELKRDWRKTLSILVTMRDTNAGSKGAAIDFIIEGEGDTPEEIEESLAERKRITEYEFNQTFPDAFGFRTVDGTAGVNRLFHYHQNDGESVQIISNVSEVPQETPTRNALYMTLEIICDITPIVPTGGFTPNENVKAEGLVGGVELTRIYDTGENLTVALAGIFKTQLDAESVGPLTIDDIIDEAGDARVNFDAALPALPDKPYITISGTALYNGKFRIAASDVDFAILDLPFRGTDTSGGVGNIGNVQEASDLFEDALPTLIEFMGVGENNLTVDHKGFSDLGDGTAQFELGATTQDFVPGGIGDGDTQLVRKVAMRTARHEAQGWEVGGGPAGDLSDIGSSTPLKQMSIDGYVSLNRASEDYNDDLLGMWETIKADVYTRIELHLGHAIDVNAEHITLDGASPGIGFTLDVLGDYTGCIALEYTRSEQVPDDAYIYSRGPLHGIQYPSAEPIRVISRSLSRIGEAEVDLARDPPTESGYIFHPAGSNKSSSGPHSYEGLGDNIFVQTYTDSFYRLKIA